MLGGGGGVTRPIMWRGRAILPKKSVPIIPWILVDFRAIIPQIE